MESAIVWLYGASGRMGQAILGVADEFSGLAIKPLGRDGAVPEGRADALIDFSVAEGLLAAVDIAQQHGLPLLSGTTGLDDRHELALKRLSQSQPVLQASNFSLGLAALRRAASELAARLDWDCEIVESHHRMKRDAPSGTALALASSVREGRGQTMAWEDRMDESRNGELRQAGSLGIASIRGGSVVGDHCVHFLGEGERVELTHRADDRRIFARGAIRAALLLRAMPAGMYALDEVLWPNEEPR